MKLQGPLNVSSKYLRYEKKNFEAKDMPQKTFVWHFNLTKKKKTIKKSNTQNYAGATLSKNSF